jgi:hypothetical protein
LKNTSKGSNPGAYARVEAVNVQDCAESTTFAGRIASPSLLLGENRCLKEFATGWRTEGGAMSEISTAARQELVQAIGGRYRIGSADEKGRILDEFVALTGYHRKHAIRLLNGFTGIPTATRRGRLRLYDEAVRQALVVFWEASDRVYGKRLRPLLAWTRIGWCWPWMPARIASSSPRTSLAAWLA